MQNGNDLPLWMSVVNIWLPSIRNSGAFFGLVSLPRLARKGSGYALVAIALCGFFGYWSLMNFHQYTELKSIDAARAKETQLER